MARYDWPASPVSEDDPSGRQNYRAALRPSANVRFDDGSLAPVPKAPTSRRARRLPKNVPSGGQDLWLPIGPTAVVSGQASGRPDVSGRIRDIAVEPTVGNRVYAASAGGGVWFSPDAGSSWRPLNGFFISPNRTTVTPVGSALSCGSIYVHFGAAATGADDEVYVGTGEPKDSGPGGDPGGNLVGVGILHARGPATGAGWAVDPTSAPFIGGYIWRIVASPLDPEHLFAATSIGLYQRPPGRDWTFLGPLPAEPVDVLVTRHSPTELRIWVATWARLYFATLTVPIAGPIPGVTYTVVTLLNLLDPTNKALALGAANELWVLGRANRPDPKSIDPAFLWKVDPTVASPVGVAIGGVPKDLFGATHDQSHYDICLTVHPEHTNQLFVGGSGLTTHGEWNAGLYSLSVSGTTATPTLIGVGVHADVHIIRVGPRVTSAQPPRSVWVGCDGGVFRSARDGDAGSFVTRNFELATLEPGYIACHPTNDGLVAAGMQDNGTCERRGDVVWELTHKGDGGGTVYDPAHEHRFFRQYVKADWESSDGEGTPVVTRHWDDSEHSSETIESKASLFYSGASALAHGGTTHLLLGTDRPWYSADWGRHWVTIPTGKDPRRTNNADLGQDLINGGPVTGQYTDSVPTFLCCHGDVTGTAQTGSAVITTRLSAADTGTGTVRVRAHVLWGRGVSMFLGTKPATDGAAWTWAAEIVEPVRFNSSPAELTQIINGDPTAFVPALDRVTDIAVHEAGRGAHGSCYVASIGGGVTDTVYWYDGGGNWYPCGVRKVLTRGTWTGDRIAAPAMAVVVDPTDPNVVFVGTSIGVIRGDLSMVDHGAGLVPEWAWRPFDNGLPESAVNDLAIFSDGTLRLLRAGLHGRGVWEVDLATVVAQQRTFVRVYPTDSRRRASTPLTGPPTRGEAAANLRFDASPDVVVDVTGVTDGVGGPTEADLFRRMSSLHPGRQASKQVSPRAFKIHVLVHHRWPFEAMPPQLKVALLRRDLPDGVTDPALDGIFQTMVDVAGGAAVPASLPGAWVRAGTQLINSIGSPTDAPKPRAATFDIDLSGHPDGRVLFVAVVMSDADQIAAGEMIKPDTSTCITVGDLVLNSRHVAARSVELT